MRVALVSDVHGNAAALETVLADLDRDPPDAVVCLGDLIQGGPDPARCIDLVRERAWPVVMGNADAFVLDEASAATGVEAVSERQLAQRAWTLEQLDDERRAFVERFAPTIELALGGLTLLACHAVPASFDPVVLPATPEEEFRAHLEGIDADVVAAGHVHLQFVRRRGATLWVNPGSVGLSYDHEQPEDDFRFDPWAAYGLVVTAEEAAACGRVSAASRSTSTRSSRASSPPACPRRPRARGAGTQGRSQIASIAVSGDVDVNGHEGPAPRAATPRRVPRHCQTLPDAAARAPPPTSSRAASPQVVRGGRRQR